SSIPRNRTYCSTPLKTGDLVYSARVSLLFPVCFASVALSSAWVRLISLGLWHVFVRDSAPVSSAALESPRACRLLHFGRWLDFCTGNFSGPGTFALR
ncbi:MAG: hypothetical protein VW443_12290, partial [Pseudomonadales bacterium]